MQGNDTKELTCIHCKIDINNPYNHKPVIYTKMVMGGEKVVICNTCLESIQHSLNKAE